MKKAWKRAAGLAAEGLEEPPAGVDRRDRRRGPAGGRRRAARLRAAEAPGRHPQRRRPVPTAEAAEAEGENGQLAVLRARPGAHPVPARQGRQAALPQTLALHRPAAARVPADLRRRPALLRRQQRLGPRPRRRHREAPLETADRAPQRLLARLLQTPALHRQPGPRPHRQARRPHREDDLETVAAGPGRVLAGRRRPHRLLRLRKRRTVRAQHGQRRRPLVDPARRADQVGPRLQGRDPLRRRLRRLHERRRRQFREARMAERLPRARVRRLRGLLLDPGGRLRPGLRRQQRRPRLQLRPPRRHRRLELLDRGLRLLRPRRRHHPAQPADRLHRLLRRQRLRARRQGRLGPLEPLGRGPGRRLALGGRRHRLRRRVHRRDDQGLHDEERPRGVHLSPRHLHAGHLRRPPPLPHRLLEHHRPAAVQVQSRGLLRRRRAQGRRSRSRSRRRSRRRRRRRRRTSAAAGWSAAGRPAAAAAGSDGRRRSGGCAGGGASRRARRGWPGSSGSGRSWSSRSPGSR